MCIDTIIGGFFYEGQGGGGDVGRREIWIVGEGDGSQGHGLESHVLSEGCVCFRIWEIVRTINSSMVDIKFLAFAATTMFF